MTLPIGVLVSGSGSNLQSIIDRIAEGTLDAEVRVVISNKSGAYGLERAAQAGIPTRVLQHGDYPSREEFDADMVSVLRDHGVKAVVMAGFMRIITPVFLNAFPERVINIHPALLPSFPGVDGQGDAAEYGVKIAGCTVHFVDEKMDHGPVVIQAAVPAQAGEGREELAERILKMEHRILPQAVQWLAEDRVALNGRHVHIKDQGRKKAEQEKDFPSLVSPALEEGF